MSSLLLLILALVLCAFLRFYQLDGYGLWSDEFVTLMIVSSKSYQELIQTCFEVPQPMPPFYFLANKWIYGFFPPGEAGLRALSAAGSVLTGYLLFAVGRALFSAEIALWGTLLFAVNSTQIVYAQNARPYAICLLLSTISMFCFIQWRRQPSWPLALAYVMTTALLFYTHYVFFPLLLIQGAYLVYCMNWSRARRPGQNALQCKSWLKLQAGVAVLLVPLYPQLWRVVHARHSLNWESKYPAAKNFLLFLDPRPLLWGVAAWLVLDTTARLMKRFWRHRQNGDPNPERRSLDRGGLVLLVLWYLLPLGLFFLLAHGNGLNLFVERYLTLASLPVFLTLPALALAFSPRWVGRGALLAYWLSYVYCAPAGFFAQKGQFSQGVPGGNEWRETLEQLGSPNLQSSLFLFQSPFIESNRLDFADKAKLAEYLSAPLHSFYVKGPFRAFVLLPVHWWIENPPHQQFKSEIQSRLMAHRDFTLLATQEFWDRFEPWLVRQAEGKGEWRVISSFRSSGALRLKRLEWIPRQMPPS
ncbi:MAG: glycosyltransferase family 39 protein [Acidobacteria bacterium]|nr:glycosyltransferase family 39 protein [Acidobacteriota bacterium]